MYHYDEQRLASIIERAYTDSGAINELAMQRYLQLLRNGQLRRIDPSAGVAKLHSELENETDKSFQAFIQYTDATGMTPTNINDDESTSDFAINQKNERDKQYFDQFSYRFLYTLRHTVFEDGTDNEATSLFAKMTKKNKYVSICWLQELWADHQDEAPVVEGIIRLIGRINDKAYWKPLMSIVRAGLTDKDVAVQESAIMVVESWRTLACYQALKSTRFREGWIKDYADEILPELEEELKDEIHQED